jgi:MoaA/NifB/PqqE/SkfB family radical SAM enzyme
MKPPADAIIAVTHRCNARCVMCNVWKSTEQDLLLPEHLGKLPPGLATINLSGGEPFLRDDLPEFVRQARARCPKARITISTNAYCTGRIVEMMDRIRRIDPGVRLSVSLDAVGDAHDAIRGGEGFFAGVLSLIEQLVGRGFRGLRLSMTISGENLDEFLSVAQLAERLGLEVGVVAAHGARTHLGIDRPPEGPVPDSLARDFGQVLSRWLRSWTIKQWFRAHFAHHTYRYLTKQRWRFRCHAGEDFFFLQADGTVYSCSVQGRPMGNLLRQDWQDIWQGPASDDARRFVGLCRESCWMICTARSVYRVHRLKVIAWVLWHKLLAHLGLLAMPSPPPKGN